MKKRLLSIWLIACMLICIVGQTPIVAFAEGESARDFSMPESTVIEEENTTEEMPEIQTEEDENDISEVSEEQAEDGDNEINENPDATDTQDENITEDNTETPEEQNENPDVENIEEQNENPDAEIITEDENGETPDNTDIQTEETGENTDIQTEQDENVVGEAPVLQKDEPVIPDTEFIQEEIDTEETNETQIPQGENVPVSLTEYVEQTVDALLPQGALNYGDIVRVSGFLPENAIVEAIPVNVEIEGQEVLLAYDITIYENAEKKNEGICWQPDERGLSVEFISSALEVTDEEVNIWHMEDVEESPEYVTAAPSNEGSVEFLAESFSVYVVSATKLTSTIVASDGNTYEINVTYSNLSGIPMEGTALLVNELKSGDEGYDEYIDESVSKIGTKPENVDFSKVFDIKIVDENDSNTVYEPVGDVDVSIRVIGVSLSEYPNVNVIHFVENRSVESYLVFDVESTVNEETVEFTTDSFSVYVVIGHENDDIVTPRVQFHFISDYTGDPIGTGSSAYYAVDPYTFKNAHNDDQTTQILKDGEALELIADPVNYSDKYFYGWYVVDPKVISGTTDDYGVGTSDNKLYYTWPSNPDRISFESPISIQESNGTVSWTINGVSGSGTADADGDVHVFLAPLFENYHFVNFMLRPKEDTSNNLMTRKLIALGSASSAEVKISDIRSNSTDPVHLVFIGWEYESSPGVWESKQTVEYSGAAIVDPGKDGVYMTLDFTGKDSINLYPVFIEARWVDFFAGVSGSGATYVASRFLESWGYAGSEYPLTETEDKNYFTTLETSSRTGYVFDGWYAFANVNSNTGEITNLTTPEDVEVSYLTLSGGEYVTNTVTVNTTALKISNGDGSIVNNPGTWKITDNGNGTGSIDKNSGTYELFKIEDGKLRFYNPLDRLKLTAQWAPDDSQITVVYWTENAQDRNYSAPSNPKDDYTASAVKVIQTSDLNTDLSASYASGSTLMLSDLKNYTENSVKVLDRDYLDDIGAVLAGEEKFYDLNETLSDASVVIKGDGSTTINVFFERKTFKLVFHIGRDNYVKNSGHQKPGFSNWDGNWIEFMFKDSKVTALGYPKATGTNAPNPGNSRPGLYSMTYNGTTYSSAYVTSNANVMGDYVPDPAQDPNDANVYVITAKYGAYIGDRWPTPTNPNFTFTDPANSGYTMYIWAAYYGSLYCRIANERSTAGNAQGANPDINGVYDYMSAELCSNREGDEIINDHQVHHLVAYFGQKSNQARYKNYHILYEAIPGTYDAANQTPVSGDNYSSYNLTTWSQEHTVGDKSEIIGHSFIEMEVKPVISNLEPQFQLSDTIDGYELVYSCYDSVQHPNSTNPSQNDYDIYFFYRPKQYTLTFNLGSGTRTDNYYYTESLENANKYTNDVNVPEGYEFRGWYTNSEGVGAPFDFANETMPSRNVVLYPYLKVLQYSVKIDPNGGVLDHRANASVSTYFTANYGTPVGEYTSKREYIKLTDKELTPGDPKYYSGDKYYYINTQLLGIPSEGDWGLPNDLRNAVYVSENDLDTYYNWYSGIIANADLNWWTGISCLSRQEFIDTYTDYPYRPLSGEHYTFMGWYQVNNGTVASMPYNFNDPVTGPLELRAMWRLDGGYYVQYNPYYFDEENGNVTAVIGEIEGNSWTDPSNPAIELYADQSAMLVLRAPTNVTSGWVFRGWRVVKENGTKSFTDSAGTHDYTNWEPFGDPNFYQPGDSFTIDSDLATQITTYGNVIHMQAYYERDTESTRRPDVTNLILDANDDYLGYISNIHNDQLPELSGAGHQIINNTDHQYNGSPTQILIGDLQSNLALHLYRYATNKTINGVQGTNFFSHTNGYLLIGFDENMNPETPATGNPYIPTFATDSVIAVDRNSNDILYAMWEPMVYATFVNTTEEDLVISLSGTGGTINIVNKATGEFDRESVTTTITVPAKSGGVNGEVKIVLPGAIPGTDSLTATTTNTHIGYKLSVNGVFQTTDPYGTGVSNVRYNQTAEYTGTLQTDATGIIITYTEEEDPSIVYDVNTGTWNETDPSFEQSAINTDVYTIKKSDVEIINRYKPADPSKAGKIFIGWTTNADIAARTDFSSDSAVTFGNTTITPASGEIVLDKIKSSYLWDFSQQPPYGQTLYAVWSDTVTVTFNIAYSNNLSANPLKLHTWGGPATTDTATTYEFYTTSGSAYVYYTMAKGEKVPMPNTPTPHSDKANWGFIKWLVSNGTTNAYRYTAKSANDGNIKTYAYDFTQRVLADTTLVTSWSEYAPQHFTFLVENQVTNGNLNEEFLYTIEVKDELVFGKIGGVNSNREGQPDERWGSVQTTLKSNQQYTVLVTATYINPGYKAYGAWIDVIDRDGIVVKSGQVIYCNKNSNPNYCSDYKYTLSISQESKVGYDTTVTVDQVDPVDGITYNTNSTTRTFTFKTSESAGNRANFLPTENTYDAGEDNSLRVLFTNEGTFYPAPTDYSFDFRPYLMMLGFGSMLALISFTIFMIKRRREELDISIESGE